MLFRSFFLTKLIYKNSDAIVVYGEHVKKYLIELGINSEKVFVGWNTVDNSLFNKNVGNEEKKELRTQLGLKAEKIILFIGRIESEKGIEYLFDVVKLLGTRNDIILLIIGNGSKKNYFENAAQQTNNLKVIFLSFIPNTELYKFYSIADVFVLPSVTTNKFKEPWGLVINEAMNQGCPIVATNAVGAAVGGLIENGKTGFIIPEKNSEELGKAIEKVVLNSELQSEMKSASKLKIQNWDYDFQSKGFFDAINYVASSNV